MPLLRSEYHKNLKQVGPVNSVLSFRRVVGVEYILVDQAKKEMISFLHLNGSTMRELAGKAAQFSIVTWYLLNNQRDAIQFVSDTYDDWLFKTGSRE